MIFDRLSRNFLHKNVDDFLFWKLKVGLRGKNVTFEYLAFSSRLSQPVLFKCLESFPSSFLSFNTHPAAVGCLAGRGSILKKTFVNANGCLVFRQSPSLYKDTCWYAFLCNILQMLEATSRVRANNPNYSGKQIAISQSACLGQNVLICDVLKVLHVRGKVWQLDHIWGEWPACSMCSKCESVPQADPQSKQPSLSH